MLEAKLEAGCGEVGGSIGGSAIGEDALDLDAMSLVEVEGLVESVEDVFDLFAWKKAGEAESGTIIDGDMETFEDAESQRQQPASRQSGGPRRIGRPTPQD